MIGAFLKLNFRYIFTPAFPEQIWVVFYNFSPFPSLKQFTLSSPYM